MCRKAVLLVCAFAAIGLSACGGEMPVGVSAEGVGQKTQKSTLVCGFDPFSGNVPAFCAKIRSEHTGLCMIDDGTPNAPVQAGCRSTANNMKWRFFNGWQIQNVATGECINSAPGGQFLNMGTCARGIAVDKPRQFFGQWRGSLVNDSWWGYAVAIQPHNSAIGGRYLSGHHYPYWVWQQIELDVVQ